MFLNKEEKAISQDTEFSPFLQVFIDPNKECLFWENLHEARRSYLRFFCLLGGVIFLSAGFSDYVKLGLSDDFLALSTARLITVITAFYAALTITNNKSDRYVNVTTYFVLATLVVTLSLVPYYRTDNPFAHQTVSVFAVLLMYAFIPVSSAFIVFFTFLLTALAIGIQIFALPPDIGSFTSMILLSILAHALGFVWLRNRNRLSRQGMWQNKLLKEEMEQRAKTENKLRASEEELSLRVVELMDSQERLEQQGLTLVELAESASIAHSEAEVNKERLSDAIDNINEGFALYDRTLNLNICNTKYRELYGFTPEQTAPGTSIDTLADIADQENKMLKEENEHLKLIKNLSTTEETEAELVIQLPDGRWIQIRDKKTETGNIVSLQADITGIKQAEEKIRHYANHDALTGLPSLRYGKKLLQDAMEESKVTNEKLAVLFIDLDGFKGVNDTEGHDAGDMVLKTIAQRLEGCVGEVGFSARIGGDEFISVIRLENAEQDGSEISAHLIEVINKPIPWEGSELSVGASIGIALFPGHGGNSEALLKAADSAMYDAKHSGKNQFKFAS